MTNARWRGRSFRLQLATLWLWTGCSTSHFTVELAPNYPREQAAISVFGIVRDGLLNADGWQALGPAGIVPFDARSCAVAYDAMVRDAPELARTANSSLQVGGVGSELVRSFAPAARGDTIMVFRVDGRPRAASDSGSAVDLARPPSGRVARGVQANRNGIPGHDEDSSTKLESLRLTADFYAVQDLRRIAKVELAYDGSDAHEAFAMFADKLRTDFPRARCSGWDLSRLRTANH